MSRRGKVHDDCDIVVAVKLMLAMPVVVAAVISLRPGSSFGASRSKRGLLPLADPSPSTAVLRRKGKTLATRRVLAAKALWVSS